ncbi:alpha/beta fold hydrolase [Shimia sp. SDUM112013]|uniref:dienelactone hydrolase family protein n=1 Tax=Shimia sp. SDUM112013 TaxID=3136160 RepID=UPI0032EFDFA4
MTKVLMAAVVLLMTGVSAMAGPTEVRFGHGDNGYMLLPEMPGRAPAVVLLHDWRGPTAPMLEEAQGFADRGYVVLVPDLFEGKRPATPAAAQAMIMHEGLDAKRLRLSRVLSDALTYLSVRPGVDAGNIALVGYDYGAAVALKAGQEGLGFDAVVAYDPSPELLEKAGITSLDQSGVPVLAHISSKEDTAQPVGLFSAASETPQPDTKVYQYPTRQAAFLSGDTGPYDAAYADLARQRTLEFLGRNMQTQQ